MEDDLELEPTASQSPKKALRDVIAEKRQSKKRKNTDYTAMMDPYAAVSNYRNFQELKTGYIEEASPQHFCHWDLRYPENPDRVKYTKRRLELLKLLDRCEKLDQIVFPDKMILRLHDVNLFDKLKSISEVPKRDLEQESSKYDSIFFSKDVFTCAMSAAQSAVTVVMKVASGELKNGLALIRPPGHHAMTNEFCGYCYFNNAALAAQATIDARLAQKVLIVDFDVHHGQGTQRMFYHRNDVLYFSIHRYEHGLFWPNLRESDSDYIGEGRGKGYNVNVPLNVVGMGDAEYLAITLNLLLPIAYRGEMLVTPHFYGTLVTLLSGLANGRVVACLEGGYFPESLAEGVAATLRALLGDVCYPVNIPPDTGVHPAVVEVINNVKFFLRDYWDCFKTDVMFEYPKPGKVEDSLEIDNEEEHLTCLSYKFIPPKEVVPYETTGFYPIHSKESYERFLDILKNLKAEYAAGRDCREYVGYIYDNELLNHVQTVETARPAPERPERLTKIMEYFEQFGMLERCTEVEIDRFDEQLWVEKTHDKDYIETLINHSMEERADWFHNEHTADCLIKCISAMLTLAYNIHKGHLRSGVAVIRPPGHHAAFNHGSGFCFLNNAVIAANYLIDECKYSRILIVDFDIHHGNGTQNLTYHRDDIMYISIHRYDDGKYFPSDSLADYDCIGVNQGLHYNVNIPFNKNVKNDSDYWDVWLKLVLPVAFSYKPDFVVVSAGFDAGYCDPLGKGYNLSPEIYGHFIQTLKPLASGRILVALEGGYHLDTTALGMTMCLKALNGEPIPVPRFENSFDADTVETIQNVLKAHKNKWQLLKVNKKIAAFSCTDEEKDMLLEYTQKMNFLIEKCKKVL